MERGLWDKDYWKWNKIQREICARDALALTAKDAQVSASFSPPPSYPISISVIKYSHQVVLKQKL